MKSLENTQKNLESRGFEVYIAADESEAEKIFFEKILPQTGAKSVSWGGSLSVFQIFGDSLKKHPGIDFLDTQEEGVDWEVLCERRRQALLSDLFLMGANAVTQTGQLVNLDATGNRIGGLTFGPKSVVVFAGMNKIVPDLDSAFERIRKTVAPQNSARLGFDTPCAKTGKCHDCKSPNRICNMWSIVERPFPENRIKVVIVEKELGL